MTWVDSLAGAQAVGDDATDLALLDPAKPINLWSRADVWPGGSRHHTGLRRRQDNRTGVRLEWRSVDEDLDPHNLENLRRSITMLGPGQPAGLDRERVVRLLEELQRLQRSDRRYRDLVDQLKRLLDGPTGD